MVKNKINKIVLYIYTTVLILYSIYLRHDIIKSVIMIGEKLNGWDILLHFISDPYVISFFILPVYCFMIFYTITSHKKYNFEIRFDSRKGYIEWIEHKLDKIIIIMILIWYIVGLISSLKFMDGFIWSDISIDPKTLMFFDNLGLFRRIFKYPLYAVIMQLCSFILFAKVLNLLSIMIAFRCNKKNSLSFFYIILVIWNIIIFKAIYIFENFRVIYKFVNFLSPIHYLSAYNGMLHHDTPFCGLIILIVIYMILLYIKKNNESIYLILTNIKRNRGKIILYSFAVLSTGYSSRIYGDKSNSLLDNFICVLYGVTAHNGRFFTISCYMILYFGFVYLIILSLQSEFSGFGYYKIIRYRSIRKWYVHWNKQVMKQMVCYLLFICFISFFWAQTFYTYGNKGSLFGNQITWYSTLLYYLIGSCLQLMIYIQFVVIIFWKNKNLIHAITYLCLGSIFMFQGMNRYYMIPIGLNNLGVYVECGFFPSFISLIIFVLLEAVMINRLFHKKDV